VSHDITAPTATDKWKSKIKKLTTAQSKEAWSIATADIIDNMKEPLFLEDEEKMRRYLSSKVAVILYYAALYLKDSPIFSLLLQEYINLVQKVNNYEFVVAK
jgi:hypothetical protein